MLDIVNVIYILTILLVLNRYYNIPNIYLIILLVHLGSIFLLNGFLFDARFMPDQFKYLKVAQNVRMFDFLNEGNFDSGKTVYISGVLFGLFPIPFIDSIYSIGMINFLFYLFVFVFMYKKGLLHSRFIAYFYLLFPSLLLYSSVALRDMLVFMIVFFATYYILIAKKHFVGFNLLFLLAFIKFQNLLIFVVSFVLASIFSRNKKDLLFGIIAFFGVFFMFIDYFTIERLNFYRWRFYEENLLSTQEPFVPLVSYFDLVVSSIPSMMKLMFRPLPWEEFGALQVLQFVENCVIFILILYIVQQNFKYKLWKMQEVKFLNMFLCLALFIYGLVIYNSGTAVRYKFPFIAIYIIYSWYFIYQAKQIFKKSKVCAD